MLINIIIVTIFLLLVFICIIPFEVLVILVKLLLLNMQIIASRASYFLKNNDIVLIFLEYLGIKKSSSIIEETLVPQDDEDNYLIVENTNCNDFLDQFNFTVLMEKIIDLYCFFFNSVFFPICLYIFIIFFFHALFGLYSAYVDYFQKHPDHLQSLRASLPAVFIFYFVLFIVIVIIIYVWILFLYCIVWFLSI